MTLDVPPPPLSVVTLDVSPPPPISLPTSQDQFCTVKEPDEDGQYSERRPVLNSLYDVFVNVRNDEREHWKTLCNLVQYDDMQGVGGKVISTEPMPPAIE